MITCVWCSAAAFILVKTCVCPVAPRTRPTYTLPWLADHFGRDEEIDVWLRYACGHVHKTVRLWWRGRGVIINSARNRFAMLYVHRTHPRRGPYRQCQMLRAHMLDVVEFRPRPKQNTTKSNWLPSARSIIK